MKPVTIIIPQWVIDKIDKYLDLKYEVAGTFKHDGSRIIDYRKANGSSDWVHTPLSEINFHTHPRFLYEREGVRWGWPSGEDLRECLLFGMTKRHMFHVVFTKEGVYTIQTTPCFRKFMESQGPEEAGVIVSVLESVFKSTHNLRTIDYNNKHSVKPEDWVKMTRELRIGMFFGAGKETCGKLTCRKIKVVNEDSSVDLVDLGEYLQMFEGDSLEVYILTKNGNIKETRKMRVADVILSLKKSQKELKKVCPKSRIFNIEFHPKGQT